LKTNMESISFDRVEDAIAELRNGRMIVVVDDENRENEGDLVAAAELITPETVNFMIKHGGGLVCMPVMGSRLEELNIDRMVLHNTDRNKTAFTVSIDARECTTGISAQERAMTIRRVLDPSVKEKDFIRPGHLFPIEYKEGGVLVRAGHTEASVDLARLAGLYPAAVICEIMNEDGTMARVPQLMEYVKRHQLKIITIAGLIEYRRRHEVLVERVSVSELPTKYGNFMVHSFINKITGENHMALVRGDISTPEPVLVRVHSECLTGDVFGSLRCDCGDQLADAMHRIAAAGRGVFLYMRQEGRGIGLVNKLKAYSLQDQGMDTVEANHALGFPADLRDYGIGAQILVGLGIRKIKLLTNNPKKISGIQGWGLEIVERIPIQVSHTEKNIRYLKTKKEKLGHLLTMKEEK
jgi:3,4-dihydroxy 2-butanone 4-phosphate synthase / GTP cyclohydrolase II